MKLIKTLLCLALSVCLIFSLCACGDSTVVTTPTDNGGKSDSNADKAENNDNSIVGTWETTIDVGGAVMQMIYDTMGGAGDDSDDVSLNMTMIYKFTKNGKVTFDVDAEKLSKDLPKFYESIIPTLVDLVYAETAKQGISKEDADAQFQAAYGMGIAEFYQATFAELDFKSLLGDAATSVSGTYEIDGDEITFEDEDGEESTATYEIKNGKLYLDGAIDEETADVFEEYGIEMPLVFKRK